MERRKLSKRAITLALVLTMVLSMLSGTPLTSLTASASPATDSDGYIIVETPAELDAIRNNTTAKYRLYADIDLSGYVSATNTTTAGWYPIGYGTPFFSGELDGNGHTISGLWSSASWAIGYYVGNRYIQYARTTRHRTNHCSIIRRI